MSTSLSPAFRRSPVSFEATPLEFVNRDGWEIVLRYADEGQGPWMVDLSHRSRWDVQHRDVGSQRPLGLTVPSAPGEVHLEDGLAINRMNRTQVAAWHIGAGPVPVAPNETAYTHTTDGHCMLALLGEQLPSVMEHLTNLDLFNPARRSPYLTQGPVLRVPCQVVTLDRECVLMTFSRGYGQTFADAAIHSARPNGLRPGGEGVFSEWYEVWGGPTATD